MSSAIAPVCARRCRLIITVLLLHVSLIGTSFSVSIAQPSSSKTIRSPNSLFCQPGGLHLMPIVVPSRRAHIFAGWHGPIEFGPHFLEWWREDQRAELAWRVRIPRVEMLAGWVRGLDSATLSYPIHAQGSDSALRLPKLIECRSPEYPEIAVLTKTNGMVIVAVLVGLQGDVLAVELALPSGMNIGFAQVAIAAARLCRYEPATRRGEPVDIWIAYPVVFVCR